MALQRIRLVTLARYHDADARTRRHLVRRHARPSPNRFHYYQPLKSAFSQAFATPTEWSQGLAHTADLLWSIEAMGPSHATALAHARDLLDRTASLSPLSERLDGYLAQWHQRPDPLTLDGTRVSLGPTLLLRRRGPRLTRVGALKLNWSVRLGSQLEGPGAEMAATALADWAESQATAPRERLERSRILVADPGARLLARPRGAAANARERISHLLVEFGAASARFSPPLQQAS
jgi:hypothetical protein